jgi:pyruvate/2-oxoglutarate dehydrogenase complex dihydrolipoamide dehydrogenase (E3) component
MQASNAKERNDMQHPASEVESDTPLVLPDDEHNRALVSQVHPAGWVNPTPSGRYNLIAIGAGTAGLVSAAGAAGLGAKVALIERHLLGGDCLNVGCVPSKGLISAARVAAQARAAGEFGVRVSGVEVDFPAVMERMRRLRSQIAPVDGVARFSSLGVDVFLGHARFTGPTTIEVGGQTLEFARAVITTGARATAPPIPGLEQAGYLTNETLFSLTELPRRLAVIGAGPIGCEMAQSFCRFGSEVTLIEAADRILIREDADAAALVQRQMVSDGVRLAVDASIGKVDARGAERVVHYQSGGTAHEVVCDALLVGVGRAPNLDGLGLEAAGVQYERAGVTVNDSLQTTNKRVYAAGDIASRNQFTHTADALARIVLQNALFPGPRKKASTLHVPWCTYTAPEIAHVGLYEKDAAERGIEITTITVELEDVDRAVLDGETEGFVRVHLQKGTDRIVGATIVAAHAGDMISELTVAMVGRVGLGTIATAIHPYPTQAEAIRKAGDAYNRTRLTPTVKRMFERWLAFRR